MTGLLVMIMTNIKSQIQDNQWGQDNQFMRTTLAAVLSLAVGRHGQTRKQNPCNNLDEGWCRVKIK